ncbi:HDIG domain-containing protein [Candidatus Bathyarchaeota archaeon]|nr:HDIG domain-containing protein [Candidatus Bathyarchaeota archaeon]
MDDLASREKLEFSGTIPTSDQALQILTDLHLRENIVAHSKVVRDIAMKIVDELKDARELPSINLDVINAAALLHDIGRTKTHGIEHGYIGGLMLRDMGVDERVVRCTMTHVLGGFTLDEIKKEFPEKIGNTVNESLIPKTLEEKIVCLADKHAIGRFKVPLKKRFGRWFRKHGRTQFLIRANLRVMKIKREIESFL